MMQPQTGIAALPAPAPGQAQGIQQALPQMKPSGGAQGATPPSNAPVLSMMDLSQLNRLFQQQTANPSAITSPSMITVLAEISKKQKAAAQQKQLEGAQAMQAAAQQPRTVRDEILAQLPQQPQMQAPPRMATGGPVAFAGGESVVQPGAKTQEEADRAAIISALKDAGLTTGQLMAKGIDIYTLPIRKLAELNNQIARIPRAFGIPQMDIPQSFIGGVYDQAFPETPQVNEDVQRAYSHPSRRNDVVSAATAATRVGTERGRATNLTGIATPPAGAPGAAAPAGRTATGRPSAGGPAVLPPDAAAGSPARSADTDAVMKIYEQMGNALASQKNLPPDLLQSYAEQSAARKEQYEAAKRAAEETGAAGSEAYKAAMARANVPFLQDTRGILGVLGGLDKRKGKVLGSLAASGEKYLGGVEAAKTAAAEKYATTQEKVRAMQALNQQMNVLNKEKETALKQGQFDRVNQLDQQILAVQLKAKEFGFARSDTTFAQDVERRKLELQKQGIDVQRAAANRQTGDVLLMEWLRDPKNRALYEDINSSKREEDRNIKLAEVYAKNIMLQQKFPDFANFVSTFKNVNTNKAASSTLKYNPATGQIE